MSARLRSPSPRGRLRRALAVAGGLALFGAVASAHAEDQPEAVKLFDKGRALMQRADTLNEGCRTLSESLKLWDRGDTVLNLALCHRRQGKTATAWAEFERALSHGTKVGFPEAIVEAKKQSAELAAILSKLTVKVPPKTAALEGITVEIEGPPTPGEPPSPPKEWPRELWNTTSVFDPGPIRVRARARGYKPFEVQVELGANKDQKTVVVTLEIEPPPPPLPPPPPPPRGPLAKSRPVWPWAVGAAGVALGAGAIVAEVVSRQAYGELNSDCGGSKRRTCPSSSWNDVNAARTRELVGYGLFVGMGAGAIVALGTAGVGLGLSSKGPPNPSGQPPAPSTSLVVSPASIAVRTMF